MEGPRNNILKSAVEVVVHSESLASFGKRAAESPDEGSHSDHAAFQARFGDGTARILVLRFEHNIKRAASLILKSQLDDEISTENELKSDIIRAAIVFLHATLEDTLRSIARKLLPKAGAETLDLIGIPDESGKGRNERKITLGYLAQHRGETVDSVIGKAVDAYLSQKTFNSSTDNVILLKHMSVQFDDLGDYWSQISKMIERRHKIVHEADFADGSTLECELLHENDRVEAYGFLLEVRALLYLLIWRAFPGDWRLTVNIYACQALECLSSWRNGNREMTQRNQIEKFEIDPAALFQAANFDCGVCLDVDGSAKVVSAMEQSMGMPN